MLDFLKRQQATFDNVLSSEESDVLYRKFSLSAVPAVFIYDRAGQLVKRFDHGESGDFRYGDVEKFLGTLLSP